ncbi:hypothetical protein BAZ12_15735 [Elizabethkingia miricola]|nr:hypothetical protein BAZ12_15735 [Elizabethkingia miricola]
MGLQKIISSDALLKFFFRTSRAFGKKFSSLHIHFGFVYSSDFLGQLAQKTRDLISEASKQQKFFDITEKTNTQHKEIFIKSYRSYQLPEEPRFPISKQSKHFKIYYYENNR